MTPQTYAIHPDLICVLQNVLSIRFVTKHFIFSRAFWSIAFSLMFFLSRIMLYRTGHNFTHGDIQNMIMTENSIIRRRASYISVIAVNLAYQWPPIVMRHNTKTIIHSCLIICKVLCQVRRTRHPHDTPFLHMNKSVHIQRENHTGKI